MKVETMESVEQRNEFIQDVIDRLLYLPEGQLQDYKNYLNRLTAVYPIEMEVKNGVRIYHVTKKQSQ
jgi:hypothetical protein